MDSTRVNSQRLLISLMTRESSLMEKVFLVN
ncbi:UNVERIFIED_CONTAM: hypothetical protein GTU68_016553 [Idotea baltica]|nr:hypothetical protein [Idotea baltica]